MCCIWNCKVEDRHCGLCLYRGDCERTKFAIAEDDKAAEECIHAMSDIVGCDIRVRSRTTAAVWGRHFVAYKLRRDGYAYDRIGRILGRNHSTMINSVRWAEEAIANPRRYRDVITIWNDLQEKLSLQKTIVL